MPQLDQESARLLERAAQIAPEILAKSVNDLGFARTFTERLMAECKGPAASDVVVTVVEIETDAGALPLRFYRPSAPRSGKGQPLVIFFHGGGWTVGSVAGYDPFVRSLCARSGVFFLSVDFRMAPEHKFPAAPDDCLSAVHWARHNAPAIGADPDGICVMGDSAGANLAVVTSWRLKQQTGEGPRAQYLLYPFLDLRGTHTLYPSRQRFGDGRYLISLDDLDHSSNWYLDDAQPRHDPLVSPILLPDISLLPPTVLVTAGFDPLADEGRFFAQKLDRAGFPVVTRHFPNTFHGFLTFGELAVARDGRQWLAQDMRHRLRAHANASVRPGNTPDRKDGTP